MLRLAGLQGADADGMPWVNRLADAVRETTGLEHGVALPAWDALVTGGYGDLATLADAAAQGKVAFRIPAGRRCGRGPGGRVRRAGQPASARSTRTGPAPADDRGDLRAAASRGST